MTESKQPIEPTNAITHDCDITILGIRRKVLKIDWLHIEKRNREFRASKKKKIKDNLDQYLLDKEIIRDLVQQIREESMWFESINNCWPVWKYYGHDELIDKRNGLNYLIIFFLDDNNPETIGVITVYPYE